MDIYINREKEGELMKTEICILIFIVFLISSFVTVSSYVEDYFQEPESFFKD